MSNFFENLSKTLTIPLAGFGDRTASQVSARIAQNLRSPLGSQAPGTIERVFGSEDEFMKRYQNFNNLYKVALKKELESTAISTGQKRMINAAMDAPVINLNLIRNVRERQNLVSMLRNNVVDVENLISNFGAPGIGLPSSNRYRGAARYLIDQRKSNHPLLALVNSFTFNIDPTKEGAEAFGIGRSNLPSFSALKSAAERSKQMSSGSKALGLLGTGKTKIVTFDVETSGLGIYDQIRSLAASSLEIDSTGKLEIEGLINEHFTTPQMGKYTMADPSGRMKGLGVRCSTTGNPVQ